MSPIPITLAHRPQTLLHQVRWLTEHMPESTAVILIDAQGETRVSYRAFFTQAARYAHALETSGVRPQDLIVSVLQHGESVLYSFWGAMLLGAIPSIFPFLTEKLDHDRYFDSVRQLIAHEEVRAVITYEALEKPLRDQLSGLPSLTAILNEATLPLGGEPSVYLERSLPDADTIAFLQHSSGTTGLQKGVMLSHRAVVNQIASYSHALQLQSNDVIVSWLPLYHDMGLIAAFVLPILQGIPLVLMSPFYWVREPQHLLKAITHHRGTLCWLPNFAYNFMATRIRDQALDGIDLSSLRGVINCSEPVYAESQRGFATRFAPYQLREEALMTCYAMAENTFAVTQSAVGAAPRVDRVDRARLMNERWAMPVPAESDLPSLEFVSCGVAIPNCTLRIVDKQNHPLPERQVGEIALRSDSMLSGYYHRDDLTASALIDGWYLTGDMGYLADDELYITGRQKDLIIVGGKNVYPQDIENLLNTLPDIHPGRVVAFGVVNANLGTEDIAVVVEVDRAALMDDDEERTALTRTIRSVIAQNTDVTARYVEIVPAQWLIKTSSGKIARAANREKFLAMAEL